MRAGKICLYRTSWAWVPLQARSEHLQQEAEGLKTAILLAHHTAAEAGKEVGGFLQRTGWGWFEVWERGSLRWSLAQATGAAGAERGRLDLARLPNIGH